MKKEGIVPKTMRLVRISLKYVFDYSIPPSTKEQWTPVKSIISFVLAPFVTMFAYGRTHFLNYSGRLLLTDAFYSSVRCLVLNAWFFAACPYGVLHIAWESSIFSNDGILDLFIHCGCLLDYYDMLSVDKLA